MTQTTKQSYGSSGPPPAEMPLTSIERFHLFGGNVTHPNVLFCRITIAGTLQREPLEKALEVVVSRHYFWNRRLADSNQKRAWISDPDSHTSMLTWMQADEAKRVDGFVSPTALELETKLDLLSTPGTHAWYQPPVSTADPHSVLFFAIHHSVCDGQGATRVANEVLIAYDNLVAGRSWDDGLRRLIPASLSDRNRLRINRWSYWKHLWKQPIAIAGMTKFLFRSFRVISATPNKSHGSHNEESDSQTLGLVGRWVSEDLSAQIDRSATEKSISVNSIAMASVFYALPTWSRHQDDAPEKKWFRMVLPISIASKDDLRSPIINRASIVQVDRCEDQMRDVESFLYYLDREVKIIVGWQFDKIFLLIVRMMSVSRWWLRRSAANPRARGTIVFTNLGQPFRSVEKRSKKLSRANTAAAVADTPVEIVDFDCAGPTRSEMPLNFTIQRYQRRYRITARFDGRVLTTDQASAFLQQVESELDRLTGA